MSMELKKYKLGEIAHFVEDKVKSSDVDLEQYVTTDSLLQNKQGRTIAVNLPPKLCSLTKYRKGDVLIGNIRPYLKKIWLADIAGGCSQDVLALRANNDKESLYLYALLLQDDFYNFVMKAPKGSKMPRGDKNHILSYPCNNIKNKEKIGSLFSSLDRKIALNRAINRNLEALAKQLYDYWFVQFDFPDEKGRPYKSSGGKMVWNEALKRNVPLIWNQDKLGNIVLLLKDGTHNPPARIESGVPLLTGTMFGNNFLDYSKATYISKDEYEVIHSQYQPQEGDVIITKIGTLGNVNYLRDTDLPLAIHCNSALLRFPIEWGKIYPFYSCKSSLFKARLKAVKGQSIQEFASLERIASIPMEIPSIDIINKFNLILCPLFKEQMTLANQTEALIKKRDELLPLLMNGQVTIE